MRGADPDRAPGTARARAFAEDFATTFAGDPPNVAITGWRRRKRRGGWKRAYTVVTVTTVVWDAAAKVLRYDVEQFPGQAGVTKGFRSGAGAAEAGATEALRFCSGFVDFYPNQWNQCPGCWVPGGVTDAD